MDIYTIIFTMHLYADIHAASNHYNNNCREIITTIHLTNEWLKSHFQRKFMTQLGATCPCSIYTQLVHAQYIHR